MEQRTIRGETVIALGDQVRARWNSSTRYLMLAVAAVMVVMSVNSLRGVVRTPMEFTISAAALVIAICLFIGALTGVMVLILALSRLRQSKAQRLIIYDIGPKGIEMHDGTGVGMMTPWDVIGGVRETAMAFRFKLKASGSRYVIKRAFAAGDIAMLRALAAEKLGAKAKLRAA